MIVSHCGLRRKGRSRKNLKDFMGFTLLEVLVGITIFAIGATITLSLITGALGNIRKVQSRIRIVEHANSVMELTLLDESIKGPGTFSGDFEDGTRWSVQIEVSEPPAPAGAQLSELRPIMPAKLLHYTVNMFHPHSNASDYQLQTLKLVQVPQDNQMARLPQ
jgi:prepilin-type N-terminal cleavage/methylation domain-containing protein